MMKPWMIMLPIVAAAAGIGWIRQATLSELNHENAKLENIVSSTHKSRSDRPRGPNLTE